MSCLNIKTKLFIRYIGNIPQAIIFLSIIISLPLFATTSHANPLMLYNIDNKLFAPFSTPPKCNTSNNMTFCISIDERDNVGYSVIYVHEKLNVSKNNTQAVIDNFITGQLKSVNGNILYQQGKGNTKDVVTSYKLNGGDVIKYTRIYFVKGYLYQWSVQEVVGISNVSGKTLFNQYAHLFSVK